MQDDKKEHVDKAMLILLGIVIGFLAGHVITIGLIQLPLDF